MEIWTEETVWHAVTKWKPEWPVSIPTRNKRNPGSTCDRSEKQSLITTKASIGAADRIPTDRQEERLDRNIAKAVDPWTCAGGDCGLNQFRASTRSPDSHRMR